MAALSVIVTTAHGQNEQQPLLQSAAKPVERPDLAYKPAEFIARL
jgi:hypothetical protein